MISVEERRKLPEGKAIIYGGAKEVINQGIKIKCSVELDAKKVASEKRENLINDIFTGKVKINDFRSGMKALNEEIDQLNNDIKAKTPEERTARREVNKGMKYNIQKASEELRINEITGDLKGLMDDDKEQVTAFYKKKRKEAKGENGAQ